MIALYLLESGRVGRVLIFDCDVHQGDGTARILENVPDAVTVSLHCEKNFPPARPIATGTSRYRRAWATRPTSVSCTTR